MKIQLFMALLWRTAKVAWFRFAWSALYLAMLSGCSILPSVPVFGTVNEQIQDRLASGLIPGKDVNQSAASASQAPVPRALERPGALAARNNLFVGLAVSGGGSRAANFGAAVFQELEALGLMEQVTVLSAVSGGGLPSAWYALHGAQYTDAQHGGWTTMRERLAFDFRTEWQHSVLAPNNLFATAASGLNRSDIMTEIFERRLFERARFEALGAPGPRKPIVLFNATDITAEGVGFAFSEESFAVRNSRLDTFPIARAVMASGAFPGAFASVTLRNHAPLRPDGSRVEKPSFTHLMDGGPADNYGIDKLLQTARSAWSQSAKPEEFGCLFIVVDSHITNHAAARTTVRDLRQSPLDFLIDPNVFDAVDTLLSQRRVDSLARLGLKPPGNERYLARYAPGARFDAQAEGGLPRLVYRYERTAEFELPVADLTPQAKPPRCIAWHVSLNELRSVLGGVRFDATGQPDINDPKLLSRAALWELVTRIRTDYRLIGPKSCSAQQLQAALYEHAHVAVQDDTESQEAVCRYTARFGGGCKRLVARRLPPREFAVSTQDGETVVECTAR